MSELFGSNDTHLTKRDIMKEDFGWEIPVELIPLPSAGLVYSPESMLYKKESLKIKAMTAKEEDILSSNAYMKEGTVINHLVKSCVLEQGFNPEELLLGDRNALLIAIRITGYGSTYPVKISCDNCSHVNELNTALTDIPIKRLNIQPIEHGKNLFEYQLPVTKKKVTFKFMTAKDEFDNAKRKKNIKRHKLSNTDDTITSNLFYAIQSIDNVTDKNKIRHFINNMPAYDSKEIRKFMRENEPGMDMNFSHDCNNCTSIIDFKIPLTAEFFWPNT